MKTLNLANNEKSEIKWHVDKFPDGEVGLVIESELDHKIDFVKISCRITCANDLFIVMQACDILKRHGIVYDLFISYLMSMRNDRVMDWNRPFSLSIVANMIKNCGAREISVLEPHSDRTLIELGCKSAYNPIDMIRKVRLSEDGRYSDEAIVFPDNGARQRYGVCSSDKPVIAFEKKRDLSTGKIMSLEPMYESDISILKRLKTITVFDDLCDAGGTFVGIAKYIRSINKNCKLNIVLTHVVNSTGITNLCANYDNVTISNSYTDWGSSDNLKVIEVI